MRSARSADDAALRVARATAEAEAEKFKATGNPVFAWLAIEAATAPWVPAAGTALPEQVREYLHSAACDIWMAACGQPGKFQKAGLRALRLSKGRNGASVPKEYTKLRSANVLLGVYEILKERHGTAEKAHAVMAACFGKDGVEPETVEARVTEARKIIAPLYGTTHYEVQPAADRMFQELAKLPDGTLLKYLQAMPYEKWKGFPAKGRKAGAKPAAKGARPNPKKMSRPSKASGEQRRV